MSAPQPRFSPPSGFHGGPMPMGGGLPVTLHGAPIGSPYGGAPMSPYLGGYGGPSPYMGGIAPPPLVYGGFGGPPDMYGGGYHAEPYGGGYGGGYGGSYGGGSGVTVAGDFDRPNMAPGGGPATTLAPGDAPDVSGTSYKVPKGARYLGPTKETREDGKQVIVDRYALPQRHVQNVEKLIEETKQVTVMVPKIVPEERVVPVPMQRMVPHQHTVMVPRTKMVPVTEMVPQVVTKMVPQQYMGQRTITIDRTIQVPQTREVKVNWVRPGVVVHESEQVPSTREVKVNWVRPGTVVHESEQILEYERPRLIPGRFKGVVTKTAPVPRGVQWQGMYPVSDEQARHIQTVGSMSKEFEGGLSDFAEGPEYGYHGGGVYGGNGGYGGGGYDDFGGGGGGGGMGGREPHGGSRPPYGYGGEGV